MVRIRLNDLKKFCKTALVKAGASEKDALTTAEVLSETEAWGTHSHGVKNLNNYIIKCEKGGASLTAQPKASLRHLLTHISPSEWSRQATV